MYYLGIDWADEKHDICILNDEGRVLSQFSISHDLSGFQVLQLRLKVLGEVSMNIERTDGLLVDWLVSQAWPVYITPPLVLHHRRPRRSKDDRGDAYLLAHLLRTQDPECRPLIMHSPLVHELKHLTQAIDAVIREQRRLTNRLIYLLKQYYPAALGVFCVPHRFITLAFIERFPTPQDAQAASMDDLYAFLKSQKYKSIDQKLPKLYAHLQQPRPTTRIQTGLVEHVKTLLPLLYSLERSRRDLEKKIVQRFAMHPEASWWKRFPGAGPLTAARLLARIGG